MKSSPHPALLQFTNIHQASHDLSQSSSIFHVPIPQKRHWHCLKLRPSPSIFRACSKSISGQPSSMAHHPTLHSQLFLTVLMLFSLPVISNSLWPHGLKHAGFPVPHHLPKCAQVHVHCISNAIQPSHPLTPSSPSALNLSQHEGLFQWVGCSHQMTKILELQHQSFQQVFRADFPSYWLVWSPCCPGDF